MSKIKNNALGVILCLAIAMPAYYLGKQLPLIGGPVFAILMGMIITFLVKDKSKVQSGITYTSKKILQYAVILLGFGMNLSDIVKTGSSSLPIIISTIATSLVVAYVLCLSLIHIFHCLQQTLNKRILHDILLYRLFLLL